jgi:hypothetical protein
MDAETRNALKRLLDGDFKKSDTTAESTTIANVGAFAVPMGGLLRRQVPLAPYPPTLATVPVVEPRVNLTFTRKKLRKRSY